MSGAHTGTNTADAWKAAFLTALTIQRTFSLCAHFLFTFINKERRVSQVTIFQSHSLFLYGSLIPHSTRRGINTVCDFVKLLVSTKQRVMWTFGFVCTDETLQSPRRTSRSCMRKSYFPQWPAAMWVFGIFCASSSFLKALRCQNLLNMEAYAISVTVIFTCFCIWFVSKKTFLIWEFKHVLWPFMCKTATRLLWF